MAKISKKQAQNRLTLAVTIVLCVAVLFGVIGAYKYSKMEARLGILSYISTSNNSVNGYKIQRLEFCLKNNITDCNNENLYDWNENHPDNNFPVRSQQQIMNENLDDQGRYIIH